MIAAADHFDGSTIWYIEKSPLSKVFSRRNISKQMDHISYLFCLFIPFSYYCHCVMKLILFPSISFTEKVSTGQTLIQSLFTYTLGSYIGLWLILSLVLMIACFINSSGASISAGIVFYFASSIISGILIALIQNGSGSNGIRSVC